MVGAQGQTKWAKVA